MSTDQFVCRTPGQLPIGYGCEGRNCRFNGGTIYNDAASGLIWVENQVSLGASETIMSICHFILVTIACAFSCKLERECQDRLGKKLRDLVCLSYEQVIRRDDAIVRPHLQSKIQESLKDCG